MNKDNYHEQGNIIIMLLLLPLGHISNRNMGIDALECLRDKIPTILCDLEKIYPPAFFDVMVHLVIHLPDEALLRCPIQYRWMYPI